MAKVLLFNPISIVHSRNLKIFKKMLNNYAFRAIYNRRFPWFDDMDKSHADETFYFKKSFFQDCPKNLFANVEALILFTAQARIPPCNLIQEATLRGIPIIAIEEVYQMMLQQGMVNNYFLPVDHFLVASDYEREQFLKLGVSSEIMEVTGCMFANREYKPLNSPRKSKSDFDLPENKPILTLCLDAFSSEVEALTTCRKLVNCVSHNLPHGYELLIKPHPADRRNDFSDLIKNYAPKAKIAEPGMPIDEILDVTDILLNRGNSQVVMDALERKIPVVLIPLGRKTFFHGFLDEAIVEGNNLISVLASVKERGIGLYEGIFRRYLSVSPEQAAQKTTSRIDQISKNKELSNPQGRLLELGLFWAWMGYAPMALKLLGRAQRDMHNNVFLEKIYRLVTTRVDPEDMVFWKKQYGNTYREWIVQSLWIKALYLRNKRMGPRDKEWLTNYPPSMNKESFLPYAFLLNWCYLNSGMRKEGEELINKRCGEFGSLKIIQKLKSLNLIEKRGPILNIHYLFSRIKYTGDLALKNSILPRLPF